MVTRATLLLAVCLVGCGDAPETASLSCRTKCGMTTDVNHCDQLAEMERVAVQVVGYVHKVDVCTSLEGLKVEFQPPEWEHPDDGFCLWAEGRILIRDGIAIPKMMLSHELIHQLDYDLGVPILGDGHGNWDERYIWPLLETVEWRELRGEL